MKIVFYRHSLLSRGGDKMILAHADHLAEKGHEVTILSRYVDTVFPVNPKINIVSKGHGSILATLFTALKSRFSADVVVADIIVLACLLFLRNRGRVLYFAQDYDESYYSASIQRGFIRSLYFLGLRLFRIRAIAVSDYLGELLQRRFRAEVSVVTNGVDTSIFYPDPDPALLSLKAEKKALLIFSRSDMRKGFDIARKVVDGLNPESPIMIWIVGEPCDSYVPPFAYHHFGYVGEGKLRQVLSSSDLFLYPSRHEGFPLMALETLACGCPLVTTEAVNVVQHGGEALVSPIEDVRSLLDDVRYVLEDDGMAGKMVDAGYRFVAENTLQRAKDRFEEQLVTNFCHETV